MSVQVQNHFHPEIIKFHCVFVTFRRNSELYCITVLPIIFDLPMCIIVIIRSTVKNYLKIVYYRNHTVRNKKVFVYYCNLT